MKTVAIIPARMGSSRFPGKPLVEFEGMPMVLHVYERAKLCKTLDAVYIATPDEEIRAVAERHGAPVVMTSNAHERCNDRVAEAVRKVAADADLVVNIQGDEPLLYPELVDRGVDAMRANPDEVCACSVARIHDRETFVNPNVAKVVTDARGHVLYISREPIPSPYRQGERFLAHQLVVVFVYKRDFLLEIAAAPQTPLEEAESIDYLRILEHGHDILTYEVPRTTISVDVPSDVERVKDAMRTDPVLPLYMPRRRST